MKAYDYLKNELEPEEEPELEEEFEEELEEELEEEELDEMESELEFNDTERYTPSIITNIKEPQLFNPYLVSVLNTNVSRREGPGENYKRNGFIIKHDIFKILEEATDEDGFTWGKIKFGWIPLRECKKI